jgi:transketolase
VEHIASLRAIPNLVLIRPADANEAVEAWKVAIERRDGPTALLFTRQALPVLDRSIYGAATNLRRGAYILADIGDHTPELIMMASGSEVSLIVAAANRLVQEGISLRLVSFPSWELFAAQDKTYQDSVLLPEVKARIATEAGVSHGWERWVGNHDMILSVDRFGASAPYQIIFENYGLTPDHIIQKVHTIMRNVRMSEII